MLFRSNLKKCVNCPPGMAYDISQNMCINCPPDQPYFDGSKCTTCQSPTYYSPELRTCTSCTYGRIYNQ